MQIILHNSVIYFIMNDISERFLNVVNYVTTNNIAKNKKDLANKIGVSTSSLTEIFSKRSNVGIKVIQNAVLSFEMINVEWLITGRGEMLKFMKEYTNTAVNESAAIYNVSENKDCDKLQLEVNYLKKEIVLKDQIIELLREKNTQKK